MDGFVRDARDDRDARAVESDARTHGRTHGGKTTHARTDVHSFCSYDDAGARVSMGNDQSSAQTPTPAAEGATSDVAAVTTAAAAAAAEPTVGNDVVAETEPTTKETVKSEPTATVAKTKTPSGWAFSDRADPLRELLDACDRELHAFLGEKFGEDVDAADLPKCTRSKSADVCVQWAQFASRRKMNPAALAKEVSEGFNEAVGKALAAGETRVILKAESTGVYMNMSLNRPLVFEMSLKYVNRAGETFGHTDAAKGKRVIIEHTSSNPNAPLHIGNLRNVMIGAHLARMMKACGHDAKEAFYVNDLGAQIGLTALAYSRVYDKMAPYLKIDHWIGAMYAVMNTCQELQQVGVKPGDLEVRQISSFFDYVFLALPDGYD